MAKKLDINISQHLLVPKHTKLTDSKKADLLKSHNIELRQLPKILKDDPALRGLNVKEGDVIKIERISKTAGESVYYRLVIEG